jgi:hypothetical protein
MRATRESRVEWGSGDRAWRVWQGGVGPAGIRLSSLAGLDHADPERCHRLRRRLGLRIGWCPGAAATAAGRSWRRGANRSRRSLGSSRRESRTVSSRFGPGVPSTIGPAPMPFAFGGPESDPDRLDADGDGQACDALPCPCGCRKPRTEAEAEAEAGSDPRPDYLRNRRRHVAGTVACERPSLQGADDRDRHAGDQEARDTSRVRRQGRWRQSARAQLQPATDAARASTIATSQKSRCTSNPIALPGTFASSPSLSVNYGRTSGRTATTDTCSQYNRASRRRGHQKLERRCLQFAAEVTTPIGYPRRRSPRPGSPAQPGPSPSMLPRRPA